MKDWKQDELIAEGYELWNARITHVDLDMSDHGCITMWLTLDGGGNCVCYGGVCLGHGYVGSKHFDASDKAMVYVMRVMDVIGVSKFSQLRGEYVRVASKGWGDTVKIIGNILKDKWFDSESFFTEEETDNKDWAGYTE